MRSQRTIRALMATAAVTVALLLPAGSALAVITPATIAPATGGTNIPTSTASTGGSGAYTAIGGPVITESVGLQLVGASLGLSLPSGFEFNSAVTTPPVMSGSGCAYTASPLVYMGAGFGSTSLSTTLSGTTSTAPCVRRP